MHETAFRTLAYRYFFFGWLFRDVTRGSVFERAAAWRHNQQQARWLPTYMRRWLAWGLLCFALGWLVETALDAPLLSMLFYLPSTVAVPVQAVIGAAWVGFKALPGPL